jgi:hypothetical protein
MYLCVKGIDFASFYNFSIGYWNYSDSVVFFNFSFYNINLHKDCINSNSGLVFVGLCISVVTQVEII